PGLYPARAGHRAAVAEGRAVRLADEEVGPAGGEAEGVAGGPAAPPVARSAEHADAGVDAPWVGGGCGDRQSDIEVPFQQLPLPPASRHPGAEAKSSPQGSCLSGAQKLLNLEGGDADNQTRWAGRNLQDITPLRRVVVTTGAYRPEGRNTAISRDSRRRYATPCEKAGEFVNYCWVKDFRASRRGLVRCLS